MHRNTLKARLAASLGTSRLDGREDENRKLLDLGIAKSAVAKITGVARPNLVQLPQHTRREGIHDGAMSQAMATDCKAVQASRTNHPGRSCILM